MNAQLKLERKKWQRSLKTFWIVVIYKTNFDLQMNGVQLFFEKRI